MTKVCVSGMELHNLTKANLARKLGISRARVTQFLNLMKLPGELIEEVERMGGLLGEETGDREDA